MNSIPTAEASPRIVDGTIRWYEGDTFDLVFKLDLTDQDGEEVIISAGDTVDIVFRDKVLNAVKQFTFTNIEQNTVSMDFDRDCTSLFRKGKYTYDVYLNSGERTTIVNENEAVVE